MSCVLPRPAAQAPPLGDLTTKHGKQCTTPDWETASTYQVPKTCIFNFKKEKTEGHIASTVRSKSVNTTTRFCDPVLGKVAASSSSVPGCLGSYWEVATTWDAEGLR